MCIYFKFICRANQPECAFTLLHPPAPSCTPCNGLYPLQPLQRPFSTPCNGLYPLQPLQPLQYARTRSKTHPTPAPAQKSAPRSDASFTSIFKPSPMIHISRYKGVQALQRGTGLAEGYRPCRIS